MICKEKACMLIEAALAQLSYAYAPYSDFKVGAALLAKNGTVYTGCNIENAAYAPTNCAERTAFFKAVSEGNREFGAICTLGGPGGKPQAYTPPCGVCRQVMSEFCHPDHFLVLLESGSGERKVLTLGELLPYGFVLKDQ